MCLLGCDSFDRSALPRYLTPVSLAWQFSFSERGQKQRELLRWVEQAQVQLQLRSAQAFLPFSRLSSNLTGALLVLPYVLVPSLLVTHVAFPRTHALGTLSLVLYRRHLPAHLTPACLLACLLAGRDFTLQSRTGFQLSAQLSLRLCWTVSPYPLFFSSTRNKPPRSRSVVFDST